MKWVLIAAAVLAAGAGGYWFLTQPPDNIALVKTRQDRLLKETNLDELREACRAFIVKHGGNPPVRLAPNDPRLPPVVTRLDPKEVWMGTKFLRIDLGGESLHYGVEIFRDHMSTAPFPFANEVAPGVWYFETSERIDRYPT
jgi:hypothetical protein